MNYNVRFVIFKILFLISFLYSQSMFAQRSESRLFLNIALNTSVFSAGAPFKNNIYSFSNSGTGASITASCHNKKNFGLALELLAINHGVNEGIYIRYTDNSVPGTRTYKFGNLNQRAILLGPSYKAGSGKFSFLSQLLYGISFNQQQELSVFVNNNQRVRGVSQSPTNRFGIIKLNLTGAYNLTKKLSLGLRVGLFGSKNEVDLYDYAYSFGTISYNKAKHKINGSEASLFVAINLW